MYAGPEVGEVPLKRNGSYPGWSFESPFSVYVGGFRNVRRSQTYVHVVPVRGQIVRRF